MPFANFHSLVFHTKSIRSESSLSLSLSAAGCRNVTHTCTSNQFDWHEIDTRNSMRSSGLNVQLTSLHIWNCPYVHSYSVHDRKTRKSVFSQEIASQIERRASRVPRRNCVCRSFVCVRKTLLIFSNSMFVYCYALGTLNELGLPHRAECEGRKKLRTFVTLVMPVFDLIYRCKSRARLAAFFCPL